MAKYLILYNSTISASENMAKSSPEEMKAGMDAWMTWKDSIPAEVKFDFGMPIQAVSRVTSDGASASGNQASGYSFMEGKSKTS